jgi:hypothetical protein
MINITRFFSKRTLKNRENEERMPIGKRKEFSELVWMYLWYKQQAKNEPKNLNTELSFTLLSLSLLLPVAFCSEINDITNVPNIFFFKITSKKTRRRKNSSVWASRNERIFVLFSTEKQKRIQKLVNTNIEVRNRASSSLWVSSSSLYHHYAFCLAYNCICASICVYMFYSVHVLHYIHFFHFIVITSRRWNGKK